MYTRKTTFTSTTPLYELGMGPGFMTEDEKPDWCRGYSDVCTHLYAYCKQTGKRDIQCKADWTAIQIEANNCVASSPNSNQLTCFSNAVQWAEDTLCYFPNEW